MRKILNLIYSTKATLWFLLLFAIAMAVATFVEDKYDTNTAYNHIYGAKWFEAIMVLLAINFLGNIKRYNLFSERKWAGFMFHIAFVVMIIGAGVTRYIGYEGLMHIREGESSNTLVMPKKVLKILAIDQGKEMRYDIPLDVREASGNDFSKTISTKDQGDIEISYKDYYPNTTYNFTENVDGGMDYVKLNVLDMGKEMDVYLSDQEINGSFSRALAYNNKGEPGAFIFFEKDNHYFLYTPYPLKMVTMPEMLEDSMPGGTTVEVNPYAQYSVLDNSFKFIFQAAYKKAKKQFAKAEASEHTHAAIILNVKYKEDENEMPVFINEEGNAEMQHVNIEGISMLIGYGEKEVKLPFSIQLNDFILDRYPGSSNPSSYASEVSILDPREGGAIPFRIYMNHILDHDGYRFFQSSYDRDEKGTILSVNHDFWGTWITYIGYLCMTLGFIFTLMNKNSRFRILSKSIKEIRKTRMQMGVMFLACMFFVGKINAQEPVRKPIGQQAAERFGQLVVQTVDGRLEPVHTMAFDVMHKMSRKDHYNFAGKGEMDAMQLFLDLTLDPLYWNKQPLIYVREQSVAKILGIQGKYASFMDLIDNNQQFKLKEQAETAFRKMPQEQNPFDKEVMKVSERMEIYMMCVQGVLLKIFPEPMAGSKIWIHWNDPKAQIQLADTWHIMGELKVPVLNYNNIMGAYLNAVYEGSQNGDYGRAEKVVGFIETIQRHSELADMLPSENQVKFEQFYNKAQVFIMLRNLYGALAIVLLLLAYLENFLEKRNKWVSGLLNFFLVILGMAFVYHTFGLGLRWYLSGHAPWSNGYEALLLVGWAGILAGFSFIRYSRIPLAATALLAFFALMTASHSSYDPQITNLQPVLKSYWLVIHVATLTISYGFLGLAFILGLFILSLYVLRNKSNASRFGLMIRELSHINEMNVSIGLVLATVGTFLGGVWANESWGRYWGWDAKETWALIITMVYSIVVHLRLVDKLRGDFLFTVGSVLAFSTVLMTFVGVNYYLSKGMHSYGAGETPVFPLWAWISIFAVIALIVLAAWKDKKIHQEMNSQQ